MRYHPFALATIILFSCGNVSPQPPYVNSPSSQIIPDTSKKYDANSWQYFLRHLPVVDEPIVDYRGKQISNQKKHIGIIPYDVGASDLQQCADALMRLRAEYLFQQKRFNEIGFHFVSGDYYTWSGYCKGLRPVAKGSGVKFISVSPSEKNHESLRKYLDIVYSYASTISLSKELKTANDFEIGTVIIYAGSPGHCFIIIDETINKSGEKVFKLAEGYTPAQSIYVLRNLNEEGFSPWYKLKKGVIETASYHFDNYKLGKFD
ncbi:MAG TPA: DUF4846 domain-containing protein [Flavisolibacter sp.]|jgi:hypothetical protein|nr:DUF4846 domain-containing protein [Flavisolibacter sp.]